MVVGASGGLGGALLRRVIASRRYERVLALSRSSVTVDGAEAFALDLEDEGSIVQAAGQVGEPGSLGLVFVATGVLHGPGLRPERSLAELDPATMMRAFAVNAVGPALIAKHFTPLMPQRGRSVFAVLSARVGSIGDDRLGGWHAYRASKAALNMTTRNVAIELGRTRPNAVCALLHPGTVDTALSAPFQRNVSAERLTDPAVAAERLLGVLDGLSPAESGGFFAYDGSTIAW